MTGFVQRWMGVPSRARRLVALGILVLGVLVVGRVLLPVLPREVELRMRLEAFREPPSRARGIEVSLERHGQTVRLLRERFDATPPLEWRRTVSVPPGDYVVTVRVELDGRVVTRVLSLRLEPGKPVELSAPVD